MHILQNAYIRIFAKTYMITGRIPEKLRNLIIIGCLFVLSSCAYVLTLEPLYNIVGANAAGLGFYGFFLIIFMILMAVPGPLKQVRWNKWVVYPYFFAAAYMTLMALEHYVGRGYGFYVLSLLLVFPALYFVWANRGDNERFLTWLSWVNVILGVAMILASYMFAPLGETTVLFGRYCSLSWNPNRFCTLVVVITSACLYLASKRDKFAPFLMFITGLACHIVWITGCRGGLIIILLQLAGWTVSVLRFDLKKAAGKTLLFTGLSAVLVVGGFFASIWAFTSNTLLVSDKGCILYFEDKFEHFGANREADDFSSSDPRSGAERFDKPDESIDSFSSGRITIWTWYIKHMSIRGYDMQHFEYTSESGKVFHNAHNTIIELGFRFGIPAGIAYALFLLAVTLALARACLTVSSKRYSIGLALYSVAYIVFALTDVMVLSFERGPVLAFCLILAGVFSGEILEKEEE